MEHPRQQPFPSGPEALPRKVQLDLTNRCNASCPQCERVDPVTGKNRAFIASHAEWTLSTFKRAFPIDTSVREFELCGNYGDPAVARDCAAIVRYLDSLNRPISMHTNGSVRPAPWWYDLGQVRALQDVCFALDGIDQQTHEYYRRFTNFEKVLENARAFIRAGGRARWQFIAFEHNQSQIDRARAMARELGFYAFTLIESTRASGTYRDKRGRVFLLRQARTSHTLAGDERRAELEQLFDRRTELEPISCQYKLYVDAEGFVYPCCHISAFYGRWKGGESALKREDALNANVLEYPYVDALNLKQRPLQEILRHEWFALLQHSLTVDPMYVCIKKCYQRGYRSKRSTSSVD